MRKSGTKHVFVSLYGVASKAEFDRAVLTAVHPFIANKAVKASLQLITGLLTVAKFNATGSLEDIWKSLTPTFSFSMTWSAAKCPWSLSWVM